MPWITQQDGGVLLTLRVVPRAARSEVGAPLGDALKIRLQAPPVDGKANAALIEFLAEALGIPRRSVRLVAGTTSRAKRVMVTGLSAADVRRRLETP